MPAFVALAFAVMLSAKPQASSCSVSNVAAEHASTSVSHTLLNAAAHCSFPVVLK